MPHHPKYCQILSLPLTFLQNKITDTRHLEKSAGTKNFSISNVQLSWITTVAIFIKHTAIFFTNYSLALFYDAKTSQYHVAVQFCHLHTLNQIIFPDTVFNADLCTLNLKWKLRLLNIIHNLKYHFRSLFAIYYYH